jgi:hypothetical protein
VVLTRQGLRSRSATWTAAATAGRSPRTAGTGRYRDIRGRFGLETGATGACSTRAAGGGITREERSNKNSDAGDTKILATNKDLGVAPEIRIAPQKFFAALS